ncbi:MAG: S24 family peptidase [Aphanocapsa feldmannii 288cV]|nr:MAG: S24 family peptidase [Aphanocapsa feldmannii 288cV]
MAPELQPGNRIVVDTSRHWPTPGELFVLWDGDSIVIKRYKRVWDSEPPTIRLHSADRLQPPYACSASLRKWRGHRLNPVCRKPETPCLRKQPASLIQFANLLPRG